MNGTTPPVFRVKRDHGHPWDGRPGFDLMYVQASSDADRDKAVAQAEKKFWAVWISGYLQDEGCSTSGDGSPGAVMYKPSGIACAWKDGPDDPHPGCRDGVELERVEPSAAEASVPRTE